MMIHFLIKVFFPQSDLENDKIRITCDDDLKFFMEESPCHKVTFDFRPATDLELSRKRTSSQMNDEASECSKRIRKQLEHFDLSSDTSSMDTDDEGDMSGEASSNFNDSKASSVSDVAQKSRDEPIPSTSTGIYAKNPNVNIISVDIIPSIDVEAAAEDVQVIEDEAAPEAPPIEDKSVPEAAAPTEESNVQKSTPKKQETNRIVISDSSSEEETADNNANSRRHSDGPSYASAYSFTNADGNGYDSRSSWNNGRYQHSHRFRRNTHHGHHQRGASFEEECQNRARQWREQASSFQRNHAENMERIQRHARQAREHAANAVRASTSAIPDLVSTFQAHFRRPMFRVADINQQIFGNLYRR